MLRKTLLLAFTLCAVALLAQSASAQWTDAERASCATDCRGTCEKNPNVSPSQRGRCDVYCSCACSGAEKIVPNFRKFNEEFTDSKDTEITRAVRAVIPACNTRAFSN
jgi:hypothetical protein